MGIDPRMANVFTITTVVISIPIAEMCFLYIATLYGGSITLSTPMLWALGFVAEFLIGGVTGIYLGSSGADIYFHDTYFVVAHFHYIMVGGTIMGYGVKFYPPGHRFAGQNERAFPVVDQVIQGEFQIVFPKNLTQVKPTVLLPRSSPLAVQ